MIRIYNNLVDDDPHSIRMFYPAFRLNDFTMHVTGLNNSAEYSVEFHLPSRDLYAFRNSSMYCYNINDLDNSGDIFKAFGNYDLDEVYKIAKKITEKVVNEWEAEIENAE